MESRCGRSIRGPRELLLAYPWPGNVRELSHVIERAVLWSRGPTLDAGAPVALRRPCLVAEQRPSVPADAGATARAAALGRPAFRHPGWTSRAGSGR